MKPTEYIKVYKVLFKIMMWAWGAIMLFYFILAAFNQVDFGIEAFLETLILSGGGILFIGLLLIISGKQTTKAFNKAIDASTAIKILKEKEFTLIEAAYGYDYDTRMIGYIDGYQVDIQFEMEKDWLKGYFTASPLIYVKNCEEGVSGWAFYKKNKLEVKKLLKERSIQMIPFVLSSIEKAKLGDREGDQKLMQLIDQLVAVAKSEKLEPLLPSTVNKEKSLALTTE